ncbi:MAG: hypothetical protein M3R04_02950 [bacterium]|nr:hypothetical protein [bacterium]
MNNGLLLLLITALPLGAALLGYLLRKSRAATAYICMAALLASAACALMLFSSIDDAPQQITLAAIPVPDTFELDNIAARVTAEFLDGYRQEIGAYLRQNPAMSALPVQFMAGRSQLLFCVTTALIAAMCLLFALWEQRQKTAELPARHLIPTLTLFSAAMLLFLTADTLLLVYLAWELMGLCSFLLIGISGTPRARRAAREAFWTTRATDFGLLLAIIIMMGKFGWVTLSGIDPAGAQQLYARIAADRGLDILALMQSDVLPWFTAAALLILLAVIGKTALLPLSFWLPEAMVAPAPVSALLHAATMVAAGPFLLVQIEPLLATSEAALVATVLVAGVTLVLTGLMALSARDAKRVLAFSTISQLCVPVLGAAVFAPGPALYALIAHAWFKAPLFLAVGYLAAVTTTNKKNVGGADTLTGQPVAVTSLPPTATGDQRYEDSTLLSNLAGTARRYPLALAALVLGGLSLASVIFTGGYFGKEQVLLALLTRGQALLPEDLGTFGDRLPRAAAAWQVGAVLMLLSIPISAAYTARLVGILGWGRLSTAHDDVNSSSKQPAVLVPVLMASVIGTIGLAAAYQWFVGTFSNPEQAWRWIEQTSPASILNIVLYTDVLLVLGGIGFAWMLNVARPASGAQAVEAGMLAGLIRFFDSGMRLREFWHAFVGSGGAWLAALSGRGEEKIDQAVMATGRDGRRLAVASSWFDDHVVDGLRYWGAEVWWVIRRWHQRLLQNGSIQHYMFVILASAVVLCFVVLPAMAKAINEILSRM